MCVDGGKHKRIHNYLKKQHIDRCCCCVDVAVARSPRRHFIFCSIRSTHAYQHFPPRFNYCCCGCFMCPYYTCSVRVKLGGHFPTPIRCTCVLTDVGATGGSRLILVGLKQKIKKREQAGDWCGSFGAGDHHRSVVTFHYLRRTTYKMLLAGLKPAPHRQSCSSRA